MREKEKISLRKPAFVQNLSAICGDELPKLLKTDDGRLVNGYFQKGFAEMIDLDYSSFQRVAFEKFSFARSRCHGAAFRDVIFRNCDFSNAGWSYCFFERCCFFQCKGMGASMIDSAFHHVLWEESVFRLGNFSQSQWEHIAMVQCDFTEAYFSQCRFKDMDLEQSNFSGCTFFQTMLKGVDFTGNTLQHITVSEELSELRGAIVTVSQAVELAGFLGIEIAEVNEKNN